MFSSSDYLFLVTPGHGVWGVNYDPFASLGGATHGGHGLGVSEPLKTNGYQHDDTVLQKLDYHQEDNAVE